MARPLSSTSLGDGKVTVPCQGVSLLPEALAAPLPPLSATTFQHGSTATRCSLLVTRYCRGMWQTSSALWRRRRHVVMWCLLAQAKLYSRERPAPAGLPQVWHTCVRHTCAASLPGPRARSSVARPLRRSQARAPLPLQLPAAPKPNQPLTPYPAPSHQTARKRWVPKPPTCPSPTLRQAAKLGC